MRAALLLAVAACGSETPAEVDPRIEGTLSFDTRVTHVAFAGNGDVLVATANDLRRVTSAGVEQWRVLRTSTVFVGAAPGRIVAASRESITGYDEDGNVSWEVPIDSPIWFDVARTGNAAYRSVFGFIRVLDAATGAESPGGVFPESKTSGIMFAVDSAGLVAAEHVAGDHELYRFAPGGAQLATWTIPLVSGMAFDASGRLFVRTPSSPNLYVRFATDGTATNLPSGTTGTGFAFHDDGILEIGEASGLDGPLTITSLDSDASLRWELDVDAVRDPRVACAHELRCAVWGSRRNLYDPFPTWLAVISVAARLQAAAAVDAELVPESFDEDVDPAITVDIPDGDRTALVSACVVVKRRGKGTIAASE